MRVIFVLTLGIVLAECKDYIKVRNGTHEFWMDPKHGNMSYYDDNQGEFSWQIWLFQEVPNFFITIKIDNLNWDVTILNQRFNGCQIGRVKTLIADIVKNLQECISVQLECPFPKGLIRINGAEITRAQFKSLTPQFGKILKSHIALAGPPKASNINSQQEYLSFNFIITATTKTKGRMMDLLIYKIYGVHL